MSGLCSIHCTTKVHKEQYLQHHAHMFKIIVFSFVQLPDNG